MTRVVGSRAGTIIVGLAALACAKTKSLPAPSTGAAAATLHDASGAMLGDVTLTENYAGILVAGSLVGLAPGTHAIHIHAVGKCEPPFQTAGGHFNPGGKKHGFNSAEGWHMGDLPNIEVPASGSAKFELLLPGGRLSGPDGILDADGAAVVVHAARDDYATDPAGNAGARVACGVIAPR